MKELPRPFDNDDDRAADIAILHFQSAATYGRTEADRSAAAQAYRRFCEHERDKRAARDRR